MNISKVCSEGSIYSFCAKLPYDNRPKQRKPELCIIISENIFYENDQHSNSRPAAYFQRNFVWFYQQSRRPGRRGPETCKSQYPLARWFFSKDRRPVCPQ